MTSKKQYLTGYVHRLEEGSIKTYAPGDVAPDWVTNTKILSDKAPGHAEEAEPQGTPPATPPAPPVNATNDDLTGLDGKALKAIAEGLGVAKNGSHDAIRDRIRAKRAENTPPAGDEDAERTARIAALRDQGVEIDDDITEAELQALVEAQE